MRKLIRTATPNCLAGYRHGLHRWVDVTHADRDQIRQCLQAMQDTRCAYCEADISVPGLSHIEHFRQRRSYPQGTFEWTNLFHSCCREEACGNFKDNCPPYDHRDLLKPDEDDPDGYLLFVSDGTISPLANLDVRARTRAVETLRLFNLDAQNGALRAIRREAIRPHLQTVQELMAIADDFSPDDFLAFLEGEIQNTAHLPFSTAIRHTLSKSQAV
ncbi:MULTISPECIES: retron Ec78 anti-phage system effector HNH endonuclease PtuB [unclassified Pseudomonas]|uniref:retron Ec78 anti-phage system effector HNH endonuclease PtuB n=1 Tax=unclassified Pseudomonas TaxID=196821 RepID=UPI002A3605C1|nr:MULTISPECIES: retron Ec78 anti-phage system effector HNH endonuclease PtuB [unclassified Pseudomonas]MDX9673436.1 TIGR02646 family protein [Pseudomonas sp. P8_250]WPN38029.1 TIGR02646 family protein [Pseudomonas sp. P8_139]WPN40168.1 TIGR02646 family protein [Pseudomonas sp. P8_229]